jgi:hypothetical protein
MIGIAHPSAPSQQTGHHTFGRREREHLDRERPGAQSTSDSHLSSQSHMIAWPRHEGHLSMAQP